MRDDSGTSRTWQFGLTEPRKGFFNRRTLTVQAIPSNFGLTEPAFATQTEGLDHEDVKAWRMAMSKPHVLDLVICTTGETRLSACQLCYVGIGRW
jgi:hypothetical protein